jgi:DNA-binding LacI/PurR family transcriptional regulator
MARKVTIQDISRHAKTSPSTVSRVLTGNATVSPEKREAVENAIRTLNYRPSQIARSLKTRTSLTVGLLLNDITNPFYSAIARGAEDEAQMHGYSLMLCNTNEDPAREHHYLQVLQDKHIDGIMLGPTGENVAYLYELASRVPLVQIDRRLVDLRAPSVTVDNQQATYAATQLLIQRGHRHIGLITLNRNVTSLNQRYTGYLQALDDAGLPHNPNFVLRVKPISPQEIAPLVSVFLAENPTLTAVLALNNPLGLGLIAALEAAGMKIPHDKAVIVFDHLEIFALMQPSISSIDQPAYALGQQAMKLLLAYLQAEPPAEPQHIVLPTRLMVRQSI